MRRLHGYAIISDDGCIADANGRFPAMLRNQADWDYFQTQLDRADLTLLGRRSHDASPNLKRRRRMIMSRSVARLERREDGIWWNPKGVTLEMALAEVMPSSFEVAVPGGQAVFEHIGAARFSVFHLARAVGRRLPGGRGLFGACEQGVAADKILSGLVGDASIWLDERSRVSLTVWRRPEGSAD